MLWVKVLRGRREYVFSVQKVINPKKINLLGFIFWWDGGNRTLHFSLSFNWLGGNEPNWCHFLLLFKVWLISTAYIFIAYLLYKLWSIDKAICI